MQAELVEIIPGGNDSAVDPKSVSTSEKRSLVFWDLPYLPLYNAHFFPAEKAPKIEMRIIHGILCFRLASLISM